MTEAKKTPFEFLTGGCIKVSGQRGKQHEVIYKKSVSHPKRALTWLS